MDLSSCPETLFWAALSLLRGPLGSRCVFVEPGLGVQEEKLQPLLLLRHQLMDTNPRGRGSRQYAAQAGRLDAELKSLSTTGEARDLGKFEMKGVDPALLWLWCRPAAVAQIRPLAWELPYVAGGALKSKKK